jgi:hypothetical protein
MLNAPLSHDLTGATALIPGGARPVPVACVTKTPFIKTLVTKTPVIKTPVIKTYVIKTPVTKAPVSKTPASLARPANRAFAPHPLPKAAVALPGQAPDATAPDATQPLPTEQSATRAILAPDATIATIDPEGTASTMPTPASVATAATVSPVETKATGTKPSPSGSTTAFEQVMPAPSLTPSPALLPQLSRAETQPLPTKEPATPTILMPVATVANAAPAATSVTSATAASVAPVATAATVATEATLATVATAETTAPKTNPTPPAPTTASKQVMPAPSLTPSPALTLDIPIPQTLPPQQHAALTEARAQARSEVLGAQNQIIVVPRHMATARTHVLPTGDGEEML